MSSSTGSRRSAVIRSSHSSRKPSRKYWPAHSELKILLDECIDRRLAGEIAGHDVKTVEDMRWKGVRNGRLLSLCEKEFDVFITVDQNLPHQQNLAALNIAVLILAAPTNKLSDLKRLVPMILAELPIAKRGRATTIKYP